MKKIIAIALVLALALGLAACGSINDTEVSILWSGDGIVKIPNSLINAMERAMYIESVSYAHYGANGDAAAQLTQAQAALDKGCAALLVELVDTASTQQIIDLAKDKNVPVVFFNCEADTTAIASYEKCAYVNTDAKSVATVQNEQIVAYIEENMEKIDRNGDGKITYAAFGEVSILGDKLEAYTAESIDAVVSTFTDETATVEMFVTADDTTALEVLAALQKKDYNSTRLNTHCIPIFTVGSHADAKSFLDQTKYEPEEWDALLYTTVEVIDAGLITGTAMDDYDSIAASVAAMTRDLVKGNAVTELIVTVPYTVYG